MNQRLCVCVSYTGFVLMAAELSQDVLSMGGAHTDLRETRQPLRCHVELGAHLRGHTLWRRQRTCYLTNLCREQKLPPAFNSTHFTEVLFEMAEL